MHAFLTNIGSSERLEMADCCGTFLSTGRILLPYQIKPANGEN